MTAAAEACTCKMSAISHEDVNFLVSWWKQGEISYSYFGGVNRSTTSTRSGLILCLGSGHVQSRGVQLKL
jgi:hypothetical protein